MKLYFLVTIKRLLEQLIMGPFVWWGRRLARKHKLGQEYDIFFFFPIYGLGGAEKVNADILNCVQDRKCIIFFTKKSKDSAMLHLFTNGGADYRDISQWTDNKKRYWDNFIYRGICSEYINSQQKLPVVFNGQCNFAYKLFPHLKHEVRTLELIHTSERKFTLITLPYVPFIHQRIMITGVHIDDHRSYYRRLGVPVKLEHRMHKILNRVEVPPGAGPRKSYGTDLKIYYAGRGGRQKRVWLLLAAMRRCIELKLPVAFHLAGNFADELPPDYPSLCTYHGELAGGAAMNAFHQQMDVLMMASAFEGFPMVIMEAMACGVVPVATAVDGVPEHITHLQNGLLIENVNEQAVVTQLVAHITFLSLNRETLRQLSENAFHYAERNFSGERFCNEYRQVIDGV